VVKITSIFITRFNYKKSLKKIIKTILILKRISIKNKDEEVN
jgi:hypothetical protein